MHKKLLAVFLVVISVGCLAGTLLWPPEHVPRDQRPMPRLAFINSVNDQNTDGWYREYRYLNEGREFGKVVDLRQGSYYRVEAVCYMNGKTRKSSTEAGLGSSYPAMQSWLVEKCK